jgi:hypothetical protein
MKLSLMDEQEVRTFAHANRGLLETAISPNAESVHAVENLIGEPFTVEMFIQLVKALAKIAEAVVGVTKLITTAADLIKWVVGKFDKSKAADVEPALTERTLMLVFEAYLNRKAGVREETLRTILSVDMEDLSQALGRLQSRGVVRKAKDGLWKYVRS